MKLENERYEVTFVEKGGEIYSFTDKQTGLQYMWQGDNDNWGGKISHCLLSETHIQRIIRLMGRRMQ